MKPRQNVKNHYNSTIPPPYQHKNSTNASSSRDIDLTKLGPYLDDMPNLQANPNLANQEDILKCLQQLYSKNNTGDLLQNLPSLSDWPMQSASPHDPRILGSNHGGIISGSGGMGPSNPYNNTGSLNNNNNNISEPVQHRKQQQHQQDGHFSGSTSAASNNQQLHSTSALANFILSTSNMHSLQQPVQPQQKSVLSLHQQHQSDLSNRRLNSHHMSASNTSFANLNTVGAASASGINTSSSDLNNMSSICGGSNNGKNLNSSSTAHASNIIDSFGSMDNMFYDNSLMMSTKDMPTSTNQQSLLRHQQLQKLLKATGSQLRSSSSPSTTTMSHRSNDMQPQSNITSNNMSQMQLPVSSPATAISPPQPAFSTVPKSLLNLAACSSSSPSTTSTSTLPSASKFSSMVSQLNLMSRRGTSSCNQSYNSRAQTTNSTNNHRLLSRQNSGSHDGNPILTNFDNFGNQKSSSGVEHISKTATSSIAATSSMANSGIANLGKQAPMSLLSDDQSSISAAASRSNNSSRSLCNINTVANPKIASHVQHTSPTTSSKDAYLANLQERAARVGVSIGEISRPNQSTSTSIATTTTTTSSSNTANQTDLASHMQYQRHQNSVIISPNHARDSSGTSVDRREIESALSRVEARNDLSLLYPSTLLGSKSQRQINALSAGLQSSDDDSVFVTDEVKRIVLEECNIIYECKECKNLFRSLANLVKHKRTYCTQINSNHNILDINQRSVAENSHINSDRQTTTYNSAASTSGDVDNHQQDSILMMQMGDESSTPGPDTNVTKGMEQLNSLSSMIRLIHNQERRNNERESARQKGSLYNSASAQTIQTSLSQLLQSQPKSRLPVSKDSALIGALNTGPDHQSVYGSDKSIMNDQLVRNSSLAKTLLNEKARGAVDPRQSLNELISRTGDTPTGMSQQKSLGKRANPKRKFLEDCIQKVKRDKIANEDDDDESITQPGSELRASVIRTSLSQHQDDRDTSSFVEQDLGGTASDALKSNSHVESDADSDMLMIDLDDQQRRESPRRGGKRRISTAASSTASSTSSAKQLNSSSALLKALTRPVDSKRSTTLSTNTISISNCRPTSQANLSLIEDKLANKLPTSKEEASNVVILSKSIYDDHEQNHGDRNENLDDDEIDIENESGREISDADNQSNKGSQQCDDLKEKVSSNQHTKTPLDEEDRYSPLFDKYTCDICKLDKDDLNSLMDHTIKQHPDEKTIYPCIFCSLSFIALENVCRHIIDIHKKQKEHVYRLKEVVQSRSFVSADFTCCIDFPQTTITPDVVGKESKVKEDCDGLDLVEEPENEVVHENVTVDHEDDDIEIENSSDPEENGPAQNSLSSSPGSDSSSSSSSSSPSSSGLSDSDDSSSSSSSSSSSESAMDRDDEDGDVEDQVNDGRDATVERTVIASSSTRPTTSESSKVKIEQPEVEVDDNQDSSQLPNLSLKQTSAINHNNSPLIAVDENDSNSEAYAESECEIDYDSASSRQDETPDGVTEQSKNHQKQSSSNKSTAETTPTSSSGTGGGIMKLKIQLKTRPDEKSKVYEIV